MASRCPFRSSSYPRSIVKTDVPQRLQPPSFAESLRLVGNNSRLWRHPHHTFRQHSGPSPDVGRLQRAIDTKIQPEKCCFCSRLPPDLQITDFGRRPQHSSPSSPCIKGQVWKANRRGALRCPSRYLAPIQVSLLLVRSRGSEHAVVLHSREHVLDGRHRGTHCKR